MDSVRARPAPAGAAAASRVYGQNAVSCGKDGIRLGKESANNAHHSKGKLLFQAGVSLLLLVYFTTQVEWSRLVHAMHINLALFALSLLAGLICMVCMSVKYKAIVATTNFDLPLPRLIRFNFISQFYALFLPSALGPIAVFVYQVTRRKAGKTSFFAASAVERLVFVLVLLACAGIPLFVVKNPQVAQVFADIKWLYLLVLAMCCAGLLAMQIPAVQSKISSLLGRWPATAPGGKPVERLAEFFSHHVGLKVVLVLVVMSLLWQVFYVLRMYLIFKSMALPFSFLNVAWMVSVVFLLQILPVSFAGLGVREGAYAFLFAAQGVPAEQGVMVGLLFFAQMLLYAVIGWASQMIGPGRDLADAGNA